MGCSMPFVIGGGLCRATPAGGGVAECCAVCGPFVGSGIADLVFYDSPETHDQSHLERLGDRDVTGAFGIVGNDLLTKRAV